MIDDDAKQFVAEEGYDPQYGARPLKRAIQKFIEDPLAEAIIGGKAKIGNLLKIEIDTENQDVSENPQKKLKVTIIE
jgi:ATP-dependent Clp protease ATP-binding subunit ClpC